jgi:hypothetical protein
LLERQAFRLLLPPPLAGEFVSVYRRDSGPSFGVPWIEVEDSPVHRAGAPEAVLPAETCRQVEI